MRSASIPRRISVLFLFLLFLPFLLVLAPSRAWSDQPPCHISYLSGRTVYLTAGREDGLKPGDIIEVTRDGKSIATIEVLYAAAHKASCRLLSPETPLQVGDLVKIPDRAPLPAPEQPKAAAITSPTPTPVSPRAMPRREGLSGRLGVRFLALDDRSGTGRDFTRPEVNLRLTDERIGGSDCGLDLRVDTRRTFLAENRSPGGADFQTRVYKLTGLWQPRNFPWRVFGGRLISPDLPKVSIFDGVLGQYVGGMWSFGLFSGTQPDLRRLGYSTVVREYGGYAKIDKRGPLADGWSLTSGVVASYHHGVINREYLFIQWGSNHGPWTTNLSQDLDFNRGWKRALGERIISPTSTYGYCQFRPTETSSVEAGYDDRRNIRLYRDRETPETQFDDSHQQGVWAGLSQTLDKRYRFALRTRVSGSESGRRVHSTSLTSSGSMPRLRSLHVRLRNTQYDNGRVRGWMHSLSAGGSIGSRLSLDLTQGLRIERDGINGNDRVRWSEADLDFIMGRSWSLSFSAEFNRGAHGHHRLYYSGLRCRI